MTYFFSEFTSALYAIKQIMRILYFSLLYDCYSISYHHTLMLIKPIITILCFFIINYINEFN